MSAFNFGIAIMAIGIVLGIGIKLGDWLGKKLCDYLDREIENGK